MAFGSSPTDVNNIPIGASYVPGTGFISLQGGATFTDASSNVSAPMRVELHTGTKISYMAAMQALVPVTGCTDLFTITGSATKTVRVTRIGLVGTTITTPITVEIQLIKRSTANTAGSSTAPTNLPALDSTNAGATATVLGYTANPTLGTTVGILSAAKVLFPIAPTATLLTYPDRWVMDFSGRSDQAPVLRGITQVLAINLVATALATACSTDVFVEWTEE